MYLEGSKNALMKMRKSLKKKVALPHCGSSIPRWSTLDWELHLQTLAEMLPYLAAAGHNLYVKSIHLYLQIMHVLPNQHPDVYQSFMSGNHSVRRSDRYWAGLSTDLIIEQVLMRTLKTSGGLTRGSGMTEQQRLIWLLSAPACAEMNKVMQALSGVDFNSGEQNKDVSQARKLRDNNDTETVLKALVQNNPFSTTESCLRNVMTGVNADSAANVDSAVEVGKKVLATMTGKSAVEYSFKRINQAITMGTRSSVKIGRELTLSFSSKG